VDVSIGQARVFLGSPGGKKMVRYSAASLISLALSVVLLGIFNGPLDMRAWVASTLATAIVSVPSYYLNRRWAWGKAGRSHLLKEVVPFWALAFFGWGFSTFCVHVMEDYAKSHGFSHLLRTATVLLVYVAAFGVFWVGKFVIFNKLMFVHRGEPVTDAIGAPVGSPAMTRRDPGTAHV
jgi:putative flippase GtrA